jgi:hypothetical protein
MYFLIFLVNFIGDYVLGYLRVVMQGGGAIGASRGILVDTEDEELSIVLKDSLEHDGIAFLLSSRHLYFGTELPRFMKSLV